MLYKNTTKGILKFRAFGIDGKKVFEVKPGQEVELEKEAKLAGLDLIKRKKGGK